MKTRTASFQVPLFDPIYHPRSPQWGGHGGLAPSLNRIYRVLKLAEADPYFIQTPHWWFPSTTEAIAKSSLFWAEAFKLVEPVEGTCRLSSRGRALLEADPYFEQLAGGSSGIGIGACPLLWILHWWLLTPPCLSKGIAWLFGTGLPDKFSRERLAECLAESSAGTASVSVLKQELSVLLETYLPDSNADWHEVLEHPFWKLGVLRYDEADADRQMRQINPKAFAKYDKAVAQSRSREYQLSASSSKPIAVAPPKTLAAALKKAQIEFHLKTLGSHSGNHTIHAPVVLFATVEHLQSQVGETQSKAGCFRVADAIYKDWNCPGIVLRFSEGFFYEALDKLKTQGLLEALTVSYLPDAGGQVMLWNQPLEEMKAQLWQKIIKE